MRSERSDTAARKATSISQASRRHTSRTNIRSKTPRKDASHVGCYAPVGRWGEVSKRSSRAGSCLRYQSESRFELDRLKDDAACPAQCGSTLQLFAQSTGFPTSPAKERAADSVSTKQVLATNDQQLRGGWQEVSGVEREDFSNVQEK
nr:hypothetical protein CFP56_79275 [Quercus suber]